MSLDVYLEIDNQPERSVTEPAIYVREDGRTQRITRAEWDARYPGREPIVVEPVERRVFTANITHNLNSMADAAGLYMCLWRPEEIGITKAEQLIEPLAIGLKKLQDDPSSFEKHSPSNGWGTYAGLVEFVAEYLEACREYPSALVSVSR